MQRSRSISGTTTTESYLTAYLTTGTNAGRASSVTLRRQIGAGSFGDVRKVEYSYYDGSTSNGTAGDLQRAVVKDTAGSVISTDYYRYYTSNSSIGYTGGMKFYIGREQYARMEADLGGAANVDSAFDSTIDDYLSNYFEYQADHRVTKEIAAGAGCSACSSGQGTYTFSYTDSTNTVGMNSWATKTVETLPDGNTNTVYTNAFGAVMLKAYTDTTTSQVWRSFWQYDATGRPVLQAGPATVTGYSDTYPDLLNFSGGISSYLHDTAGPVGKLTYGTSTTATSGTPGDVLTYLKSTDLKRGESGTAVPQQAFTYTRQDVGTVSVFPVAAETVYRNTNGTGGQSTTSAYVFHSGTFRVQQETVTRPAATTGQNGSGNADADVVVSDTDGRPVWVKDGSGFITFVQYDPVTGAATKIIRDVDTTQTTTFTGLPSGWSTPSGGGLHLTTSFEVDDLGRVTKETTPAGDVTYTVYSDSGHEVRVYPGWDSTNLLPTGPTRVYRMDWARGYNETLTMSATPTVNNGRPTGGESIASVQSLAREVFNQAGQVIYVDQYVTLSGTSYSASSVTLGTAGTNYHRTQQGYGSNGLPNKTVSPTGTIYRTVTDGQGRPVSEWVGTDDTPTTGFWSPSNLAGTDTVKVHEYVYDDLDWNGTGDVGDGNLSHLFEYPKKPDDFPELIRRTDFFYDWRDRPVATKWAEETTTESASLNRPIEYLEYDNLSQVVAAERYDGDGVTIVDVAENGGAGDGVPDRPSSSLLRAKATSAFDEQGRDYQDKVFSVDPSNGNVSSNALTTNRWLDARGLPIKTSAPGGLVSKDTFDGAGRPTKNYLTDGGGDSAYGDAVGVTGDAVLQQTEWSYDLDGNLTFQALRQRFHDETGTGALGTPTTGVKARVYFQANYFDRADRLTHTLDVGTFGGSTYTRPSNVPTRSDIELVTSYSHNAAGWVETVTDPRGLLGKTYYDLAGQVTKTIENYVNGTVSDADDKTVEFAYNGNGSMTTLSAKLTGVNQQQVTENEYGVSTTNELVSNDLVEKVHYPDPSSGSSSSTEMDVFSYNRLGEVLTKTDRNGTVHEYTRDLLGRVTVDKIATLGSGVDGSVLRIEYAYDTQGNLYLITSYDATTSGNIVNQVQREFNGLGQLTREYQATNGAVNTLSTPSVQYTYSEMSGGANHSRLTSITYPNGRVITSTYATGVANTISRLSSLSEGGDDLEAFSYLGLDTVVKRDRGQAGDLTYFRLASESHVKDGGDKYWGLDRFGRVGDHRWVKNTTDVDRREHGYDRDSNRLFMDNLANTARSELYAYDGLNQLISFQRGTLNSNKNGLTGSASRSQSWDFDALGNFDSQTTDVTAQTRSHNKQNEVTAIGSATPTYSTAGELTTDETGRTFKYDAWGHLVEVRDSGSTLVATYRYDGLGRRVREVKGSTTTDFYYSDAWQVLEERVGGVAYASYVWSPVYVDALVMRSRDTDGNGSLDQKHYVLQDANWNVVALVNVAGTVQERYAYDSYGGVAVLDASWGSRSSSLYAWKHGHQGLEWDAVLGGYHNRRRILDPEFGRFNMYDPIGFWGGDVDLYRYVENNPVNLADPSGLQPLTEPDKPRPPSQWGNDPYGRPGLVPPFPQIPPGGYPQYPPSSVRPPLSPPLRIPGGFGGSVQVPPPPLPRLPSAVPPETAGRKPFIILFRIPDSGGLVELSCQDNLSGAMDPDWLPRGWGMGREHWSGARNPNSPPDFPRPGFQLIPPAKGTEVPPRAPSGDEAEGRPGAGPGIDPPAQSKPLWPGARNPKR